MEKNYKLEIHKEVNGETAYVSSIDILFDSYEEMDVYEDNHPLEEGEIYVEWVQEYDEDTMVKEYPLY